MIPEFHQRKVTLTNGNTFNTKFYIANPMDFCIEPSGSNKASEWATDGAFGTNASFYTLQASGKGYMNALHIFRNKNMSEYPGNVEGGNENCAEIGNDKTAMDILCCNGTTKKIELLQKKHEWTTTNNHGVKNMEWGIGGINMFPTKTYQDKDDFFKSVKEYYSGNLNNLIQFTTKTSRTAIGVRNDGSVILVAVFGPNIDSPVDNGPTMYDIHLLMKYFGCVNALCLDGSTCTKISYKENGKLNWINNGARETYCRIRLLVSAADKCKWDLT